ncbi:MAG: LysR substrate-binding domain-containing protein, partial [Plesiomonas shigelloides]
KEATLHGAGISLQPLSSVKQDLAIGTLRCLLSEFVIPSKTLCFLYPVERRGVPKVRVLGEYLQACFL